jgi:hypothetical protein
VTSVSRSGGSATQHGISYKKADIFSPEKYRDCLRDARAVIYSAGMLLEGDYKSLAQGKWDTSKVLGLLSKSRNPLQADPNQSAGYDRLNRDGGVFQSIQADVSNSGCSGSCQSRCPNIHIYFSSRKFPGNSIALYYIQAV